MRVTMGITRNKILFFMFFVSGFCGLLYQIVWVRLAFAAFGVNTPVLSVVVSVFMLGLGLGSWLSGIWAERRAPRFRISPIYGYATVEFLIGLGAFAVPNLFRLSTGFLLQFGEMNSFAYLFLSAVLIVFSILPWCLCMGATFPLMMSYVRSTSPGYSRSFSFLYMANVLGALTGTLATIGALIELWGLSGALWVGALLNFAVSGLAFSLGRSASSRRPSKSLLPQGPPKKVKSALPSRSPRTSPLFPFFLILFLTGLGSMAMEVVWTRAFVTILLTQVYSFGMILFTYLLSTWLGSWAYRLGLGWKKVFSNESLLNFLSVASFFPVILADPRLNHSIPGILLTIVPFCAALGYLTPKLIDEISQGNPGQAGKAYAVNVMGCILGPLLASYFLLPCLGAKISLIVLALPFVFLCLFRAGKGFFPGFFKVAAAGSALVGLLFSQSYETPQDGVIRRDYVATVISNSGGMSKQLLVNGVGITQLTPITKFMAHLPLCLLKNKPERVLDICLGMGTTFRSLMSWGIDVTAVELVPSVRAAFGYYFDDADSLLKSPNGRILVDDGRRYLKRTGQLFDLITIDPPPPVWTAGSSLLYSKEFYEVVKKHLKKGGLLQQWYPGGGGYTDMAVVRSLVESFPYIKKFPGFTGGGTYYIASMDPIDVPSVEEMISKMPPAAQKDLLEWSDGQDIRKYVDYVFSGGKDVPIPDADRRIVITDDIPYNEYFFLRQTFPKYFQQ